MKIALMQERLVKDPLRKSLDRWPYSLDIYSYYYDYRIARYVDNCKMRKGR